MADGYVPPVIVRGLTAALAVFAVLGFIALSIYGIVKTFEAHGQAPSLNDAYLYVTAALSALVGGVVAVAFGQAPPPTPPAPPSPPAPPNPAPVNVTNALSMNLQSLGSVATARARPTAGAVIGSLYALSYVILGIAAVVIWIAKPNEVADPIKALASTFVGLVLPIVRAFFR